MTVVIGEVYMITDEVIFQASAALAYEAVNQFRKTISETQAKPFHELTDEERKAYVDAAKFVIENEDLTDEEKLHEVWNKEGTKETGDEEVRLFKDRLRTLVCRAYASNMYRIREIMQSFQS